MQFRKAVEGKVAHQKKAATIAFFILLVCWTPALIAGFPGYFTYDSGLGWLEQWGQYSTGNLNAHHPVLHTLFVGSLISVGQALFDSFNAGVLLAVFVQALLVSFLLSFSLYQLLNLGMGKKGLVASTVYLALNPIIQLFAFCTTKDVLFSAFVVVYVVLLFRLVHEKDKSNTARVILLSVLLFFDMRPSFQCYRRISFSVTNSIVVIKRIRKKPCRISCSCIVGMWFIPWSYIISNRG